MEASKNKRDGSKKWGDSLIGFYIILFLILLLTALGVGLV